VTGAPPLEISVQELKRLRDEGSPGAIVDVREVWEHEICRIPGSVLMPLSNFAKHVADLDPAQPLYLYCHHGARSLQAAMWLRSTGFAQAASVKGGIDAWSLEIDPAVPRY
jgi:rhodanese-related sulfurtransferase